MFAWLTGKYTKKPLFLELRSSNTFIIIVICIAIFTGKQSSYESIKASRSVLTSNLKTSSSMGSSSPSFLSP
jgi:hypothetical protein